MLQLIETIYIIGAVIALAAGVPQIKQLLLTKASDEFSLATWGTWLGTQCCTLMYVMAFGTGLMAIVNAIWVAFYCLMLVLIVRYRPRQTQPVPVYEPSE